MRKFLVTILSALMVFCCCLPVKAAEKSVQTLNQDKQIDNTSESVLIDYNGQQARVFYGTNGIDIIGQEETVHFDTNFTVVKLAVLEDVNGDGFVDFLTYQNATEFADQIFVISGKDGQVISSFRLTHEGYDDTMGTYSSNSYVMQLYTVGSEAYVVSDYRIYCLDVVNGDFKWYFNDEDNIWKVIKTEDNLAFINQLGEAGLIDSESGELLYKATISEVYEIESPYDYDDDATVITTTVNLWDIYYSDQKLYIVSEDGNLTICDEQLNVESIISLGDVTYEQFISNLQENNFFYYGGESIFEATGLMDYDFMGYQIVDESDDYLLISCHLVHPDCQTSGTSSFSPAYVLVNKQSGETMKIDNSLYGYYSDAIIDEYQGETAVITANSNGSYAVINVYSLEGQQLLVKTTTVSLNSSTLFSFSRQDEGCLLEIYGNGAVLFNEDFSEASYLYDSVSSSLLYYENEQAVVVESVNGYAKRIVAYQSDLQTELWTYQLDDSENNQGFEFLLADDYDGDGILDVLTIVNKYDSDGQATASNFVYINGADGSELVNKKVSLGKAYDEKGKAYTAYLVASSLKLVGDLDNDGLEETYIDSSIYSSKNFKQKGSVSTYIDFDGTLLEVGDTNGDGFNDYVGVSAKSAVLYTSKVSGYNVTYSKTKTTATLDSNFKNDEIVKLFGDVDGDGVSELITSSYNDSGYQVYDIYNGKTLEKMYELEPDGVTDEEMFYVLDADYNGDGYNEIWGYNGILYDPFIISGKDGTVMQYIREWVESDYDPSDVDTSDYYHPDEYIEPVISLSSFDTIPCYIGDFNDNGYDDYAIIKNFWNSSYYSYTTSLFVYDGKDNSVIYSIFLYMGWSYDTQVVKAVEGSSDYYVIENYSDVSLYQKEGTELTLIASYSSVETDSESYLMLDDSTIVQITDTGATLMNIEPSFELVEASYDDQSGVLSLQWNSLVDYSIMTIADNSDTVYTGTDQQAEIRLVAGSHYVTLSLEDSYGKSSSLQVYVEVEAAENYYKWFAALGLVVLIGALFINLNRKVLVRRKTKEELK